MAQAHRRPSVLAASACAAAGLALSVLPASRGPGPLPLAERHPGCKPTAPIEIEVEAPRDAGGRLSFHYTVTPLLRAQRVAVEVRLPDGGEVLEHAALDRALVPAATPLTGSARVATPAALPGFRVQILAHLWVAGEGAPGGSTRLTAVETLVYGEPDPRLEGTPVTSGGLLTLDTRAVHRGGAR